VKKIVGKMVVLERRDKKSQVVTELVNLKLFYKKGGKGEETKSHPGTVSFERRRYPRVNVDLPTQYNKINSSISRNGRVMNLSEGGMLIHSPGQIEIGQHLNSNFSFPSGSEMNIIETLVEVAWMDIHSGEVWGDYRCGVKFIGVSPEDMTKLKNFLGSFSL
jgi:c-di-GMP-binding flagellar brake protein YcgR